MTNESSANAIIGNTLRIIASGEYHPGAELTQKMASYIIELEQKLTDMAVQLANAESKCRELDGVVAENVAMKAAFDKPQAYLSWYAIPPTWEDPLPCGEYLDVHEEAGHKNSDGTDCWPVFAKPEIETPATDAFLAEVRAQVWIKGSEPAEFGRYWVRYETDVGPQYCSAKWMEYNFCAGSDTNIHKIWLADHSRSMNRLRGVTHYTRLPDSLEIDNLRKGAAL